MDAEQIVEKILSDAQAEADKIKAEAQEKAVQSDSKLAEELAAYRVETERLAGAAAADRKSRMLANARMEVRKEHLAARHALLDEVFVKANEQIAHLPDAEYKKLIMGLMVKAAKSGDEEVVIGKNENRINDRLIKDVNRRLGPGYRGNLRLAGDRADIDSGFILRRGKVQVNVSTDVLVAQAREALEMEIIGELFGE
ncbi:MAG: hypothetical protein DRP66_08945 [Planctomycetota bacterium]|nr:MAG: hypothetical protein DRP66_08945 [Planctomycetota bacterium]